MAHLLSQLSLQGDTSRREKPPIDLKTKVPFRPRLAWPGLNGTFVLKPTGGFAQRDVSLCNALLPLSPLFLQGGPKRLNYGLCANHDSLLEIFTRDNCMVLTNCCDIQNLLVSFDGQSTLSANLIFRFLHNSTHWSTLSFFLPLWHRFAISLRASWVNGLLYLSLFWPHISLLSSWCLKSTSLDILEYPTGSSPDDQFP